MKTFQLTSFQAYELCVLLHSLGRYDDRFMRDQGLFFPVTKLKDGTALSDGEIVLISIAEGKANWNFRVESSGATYPMDDHLENDYLTPAQHDSIFAWIAERNLQAIEK